MHWWDNDSNLNVKELEIRGIIWVDREVAIIIRGR
jgi:hypothetical protein